MTCVVSGSTVIVLEVVVLDGDGLDHQRRGVGRRGPLISSQRRELTSHDEITGCLVG